jgi:small subunit ribosomal protein S8
MVNDVIADMITRIRNANLIKSRYVYIPKTRLTVNIAQILKEEGFIKSFNERDLDNKGRSIFNKFICLSLKYKGPKQKPCIVSLRRISKPGLRVYVSQKRIPKVLNGVGTAILSTSQGLMTDHRARFLRIGGEVLCYIW